MFSKPEKYLFYHIPKTGGTTLKAFLDQKFHLDEICPRSLFHPGVIRYRSLDAERCSQLNKYRFIRDHFFFNLKSYLNGKIKTLTWFRDPFKRVLSQFYYYRSYTDSALESDVGAGRMTLQRAEAMRQLRTMEIGDFLKSPLQEFDIDFKNTQSLMLANSFLKPGELIQSKDCFQKATDHLKQFDCFGLLELFEPSLQLMCFTFGWRYPKQIQPLNQVCYKQKPDALVDQYHELLQPFVDQDIKLYAFAQRQFLVRYRQMIRCIMRWRALPKGTSCEDVIRNPFTPEHQLLIEDALRWSDSRIIKELRNNYPHLTQAKKETSVKLTMSQSFLGDGWLEREGVEQAKTTVCRWTGPGCESELYFYLKPGLFFMISVMVLETLSPDILAGMQMFANGEPLTVQKEPLFENGARLSSVIPLGMIKKNGLLSLKIAVPRTTSHFEYNGSEDKRPKGLRISEISLVPLKEEQVNKLSLWR